MQPERRAEALADYPCVVIGAYGARKSVAEINVKGAISIAERRLDPHIRAALESADMSQLGTIRLAGSAQTIRRRIAQRLTGGTLLLSSLALWLGDDIDALMQLFSKLTDAEAFLVRLEAVSDDGCSRFHADNVRYRLITTYSGPGSEWISPPYPPKLQDGTVFSPEAIERLQPGWIAIMRGRKAETKTMPALLHRSPPMTGGRQPRLFLAIDDLADHPRLPRTTFSAVRIAAASGGSP